VLQKLSISLISDPISCMTIFNRGLLRYSAFFFLVRIKLNKHRLGKSTSDGNNYLW